MRVYSNEIASVEQLNQAHESIERSLRESLKINVTNGQQIERNNRMLMTLVVLSVVNLAVSIGILLDINPIW